MTSRQWQAVLGGTAVFVALALALLDWGVGPSRDAVGPVVDASRPASSATSADSVELLAADDAASEGQGEREAAASAAARDWLRGRALSSSGAPVAEAQIRIVERGTYAAKWWETREARAPLARTTTDGAGEFVIPSAPASRERQALWALAEGYEATLVELPETLDAPVVVQLNTKDGVAVRVVTDDGEPVWAATVHLVLSSEAPLWLERETDEQGRATLPYASGEVTLFATLDDERSTTWTGRLSAGVPALVLGPTFSAGGIVAGGEELRAGMTVRARGASQGALDALQVSRVDASGQWRASGLPYSEGEPYVFELDGPGIPSALSRATPAGPGDELRVDFEVADALRFEVRVCDVDGQRVSGVTLRLWRQVEDSWTQSSIRTDENGLALAAAPRDSSLSIRCAKEGFSKQAFGPFQVPYETTRGIDLVLPFTTKLTGVCLSGTQPVEDFDVSVGRAGTTDFQSTSFHGRKDGRFELEEVPTGELLVYASTAELPHTRPLSVSARAGLPSEVELQLPAPARAEGIVVDAVSGDPIPGALVQAAVTNRRLALAVCGPVLRSAADGAFSGLPVNPEAGALRLEAEGYTPLVTPPLAAEDGVTNFGRVQLSPTRNLVVRFEGSRQDLLDTKVELLNHSALRDVPEDGVVVFPNLSPDTYTLIYHPREGSKAFWRQVTLHRVEASDWQLVVSLEPADEIHVEVAGSDLPDLLWVCIRFMGPDGGERTHWADMYPHGDADFFQIDADRIGVEVYDPDMNCLATKPFDLSHGIHNPLTVELPAGRYSLHLSDSEGQSVGGARVLVHPHDGLDNWWIPYELDDEGSAQLSGLRPGAHTCQVTSGLESRGFYSFTLAGEEDHVELSLDDSSKVQIRAAAGGVPLQGYECRLYDDQDQLFVARVFGDSHGLATLEELQQGDYLARIIAPGIFVGPYTVHSSAAEQVNQLVCRQLGSLGVTLSTDGRAVSGARLSLRCRRTGVLLEDWYTTRALALASLTSDSDGRLELPELPEGEFDWTAQLPDRSSRQGLLTIVGRERATLRVE